MSELSYAGNLDDLLAINNDRFVKGSTKSVIFGPGRFWEEQVLRCFTLEPGAAGNTHRHPWPHYVFVHRGQGAFVIEDVEYKIEAGSWVHVPTGVPHSFWNSSQSEPLQFLCIVPPYGDVNPLDYRDK